jgi:hypothetical protein
MHSAEGYVELVGRVHGPIPSPVDFSYIWGDALEAMAREAPDVRIIQSGDQHHRERGLLVRQGHTLSYASAKYRLHYGGQD